MRLKGKNNNGPSRLGLCSMGFLLSTPAFATAAPAIPEPSILALLIAGGIVGGIFVFRNRKK